MTNKCFTIEVNEVERRRCKVGKQGLVCRKCSVVVKHGIHPELGEHLYCKCQSELFAEFDKTLWSRCNDKSVRPKDWSDKKLKEEGKALYEAIYKIDCYGVNDMLLLGLITDELLERGYEVIEDSTIKFRR